MIKNILWIVFILSFSLKTFAEFDIDNERVNIHCDVTDASGATFPFFTTKTGCESGSIYCTEFHIADLYPHMKGFSEIGYPAFAGTETNGNVVTAKALFFRDFETDYVDVDYGKIPLRGSYYAESMDTKTGIITYDLHLEGLKEVKFKGDPVSFITDQTVIDIFKETAEIESSTDFIVQDVKCMTFSEWKIAHPEFN